MTRPPSVLVVSLIMLAACSAGATGSAPSGPGSAAPGASASGPAASAGSVSATATARPTAATRPPAVTASPTRAAAGDAVITPVPDSEWALIVASGAWHPGCPATQQGLRRVAVNFHGFDAVVHRGVLVVNADVAAQVASIFSTLFDRGYPIHRMLPIEAYHGDDNASMAADNTSAYNCRRAAQANAPPTDSPHANGRAVDLNPYENPWVDDRCHCFQPDAYYGTHRSGPAVIVKGGLVWDVFTAAGWIWQDNTSTDYQHFDTGYPSRPR